MTILIATALNHEAAKALRMALNFELAADGVAPEWIELLPAGEIIIGRDGRTWINDQPDIILSMFAAEGKDLPVDWEHSTQLKAPAGDQAPAAGWIKELDAREGGSIWGRIEWTPKGGESITNKEYRYFSPVFDYEIESRRIFKFKSCGLTNQPNLFIEALNSVQQQEELNMVLADLLAALGLPATATFQEALNQIARNKADHATALNQVQNPPLDKFVPRGDYDTALNRASAVETELKKIKDTQLETSINSEIDAALKAGKITPATKEYHEASCRQEGGLERFKGFVNASPVIAGDSGLDDKELNKGGTALNAEELKVAGMFGNSAEDIKKYGSV
ncbi:MAG: phage protease [Pseudomonadota bacterium]